MRLRSDQIGGYLKRLPEGTTSVLIYGPDSGKVCEYTATLSRQIVSDNDPFLTQRLTADHFKESPSRLVDAILTPSLLRKKRVILITGATDRQTSLLKEALPFIDPFDCALLVQAGDLGRMSTLRALYEKLPGVAAMPCYEDDARAIADMVRQTFFANGISIDREASDYLLQVLGSDRQVIRQELEKLVVYALHSRHLTVEDARNCCPDTKSAALDEIAYCVLERNFAEVGRQYEKLIYQGLNDIAVLRAVQALLYRLFTVKVWQSGGVDVETALKKLRPPVFFKYEVRFTRLLGTLTLIKIQELQEKILHSEIRIKKDSLLHPSYLQHELLALAA